MRISAASSTAISLPGNILVAEDGQPKVLDFGVARRLEQTSPATIATETGQLVGTLAYMSPEQVQAIPGAIDTRTDIHALGRDPVPSAHAATAVRPRRSAAARAGAANRAGRRPAHRSIDASLRGDLEIIIARALAKEKLRTRVR